MQQKKPTSQHHRKRKLRFRRGQELIWKEQRRFLHVLWELKEMKKDYHVLSNHHVQAEMQNQLHEKQEATMSQGALGYLREMFLMLNNA
jgi:hypothetical protein